MPDRVKVIDKESGIESFVPVDDFDPIAHEVVEGQVATVAPLGGDEFAAGQEVTERSLAGGEILPQFSPQARAELTAEQVEESTFDTAGNIVEQGLRGVASGATFGISESALAEDDPFERERARRERGAASGTFAIGEVLGGIGAAALSGGTGALGNIARLSPSGRLAANVGRWASGSKTLAGRAARSSVGTGLESGLEFVGNSVANEVIQENPKFSAEALASNFGLGAVVGAGVGAVGEALGAGLRRARRARETPAEALERQFADVPDRLTVDPVTETRAPVLDESAFRAPRGQDIGVLELTGVGGSGIGGQRRVVLGDIVGKDAREKADDGFRDLVTHIDDRGASSFSAATDDMGRIVSQIDEVGIDDAIARDLKTGLSEASSKYMDAGTRARGWLSDASDELGVSPDKLTAKKLDDLSPDLEDRGIAALAELDEAETAWRQASAEVDDGLASAIAEANAAASGQPTAGVLGGARQRFADIAERLRTGGTGGGVVTAIGVAEGARDLGIDVPLPSVRDVPLVGEAVSLFTKMKALSRATGVVPATPATRAARSVTSARDRIGSAVRLASRTATRIAARPLVRKVTARSARSVAREIQDIRDTTPAEVEASAHEFIDAPIDVKRAAVATAVRAHQYLSDVAPSNPLAGTPAASLWVPTAQDQIDWKTRRDAVRNPVRAIRESMAGGFPDLAVEALREVYPALYEDTRARLQQDAAKLQRRLPAHQLQAIGRAYGVPLTLSQTPGYGAAAQQSFAQAQDNDREAVERFANRKTAVRPINPGTSAVSALTESPLQRLTV